MLVKVSCEMVPAVITRMDGTAYQSEHVKSRLYTFTVARGGRKGETYVTRSPDHGHGAHCAWERAKAHFGVQLFLA
jgi:hypothetical protein